MHELKIFHKGPNEEDEAVLVSQDDFDVKVNLKFNQVSDSHISISLSAKKSGSILKPNEQLLVSYRVNKVLQNFEDYPNDI